MGILSNFIGAAAGAGGEIMQRQREADVAVQSQKTMAEYNNELALKREETIRQAREAESIRTEGRTDARTIASEGRAEARTVAGEERGLLNRGRERQNIVDETVRNAPKLREVKVADTKATEMVKYDPEIQARKLQVWKDDFVTKTEAELKAEITRLNDPKYLQGKAKEAAAGRDPNSAALHRVQLEAAQMALKEKQEEAKIPAAVKDEIAGLRELIKGKSAIIDKATVEGTATPEGLAKMEAEKSAMAARVSQLRNNYLPEGLRAPYKAGGSMQDVRVGGKVIGQASTAEEAAAMVAKHRQGGAKTAPAPGAKETPPGPPVDRLRDQPIGILTPLATIKEAAAAGNKQAIAYLERRIQGQADTQAAPRTAAEMLNR